MTAQTTPNIALCYVRLSYTRDEDDSNSPERQRDNIQRICDEKGWQPEWYEDTGGHRSGRSVDNRPQWRALEKRLGKSDIVALVANDLSRLHRKGWRVGALLEHLEKHDVALVTASTSGIQIDTSTTQGRIFVQLAALFDEYYAEDVSAKARDSIRHRKRQGKSVGRVPFGTQRDTEGYLVAAESGAWLLPDGTFHAGQETEPPHPDAVWRGYFDAAKRALEIYAEGKKGIARIAYQLDDEGWCYRTVQGQPRAFERDDVRRIVANWREYGGLVSEKRACNRPAYDADDPDTIVFNPDKAVMPIELLKKVAHVRQNRTMQPRRTRTHNVKIPYPLAVVARCNACSNLDESRLPSRTSTLQGYTTSSGARRYRHSPGMKCTTRKRSVLESVLNREFERILDHLIVKSEYMDLMQRIALQGFDDFNKQPEADDLERQKAEAIAKCRHRLERARFLFVEGDIAEDEYLRIRETNEQEIAHWQARTVRKQQVLIELMTVLGTLTNLKRVWYEGTAEDKKGLVNSIFDYILFDLDTDQITDFRLQPWADQYLIVRAEMIVEQFGEALQNGEDSQVELRVSGTLTRHILRFDIPLPASTESDLRNPDKEQLRADILVMRERGMSYRQIARAVGLHWTRVQQILKSE